MRAALNLAWNITFTSLAITKKCEKCAAMVLICISRCICDLSGFNSVRLTTGVNGTLKGTCAEERRKREKSRLLSAFLYLSFFPRSVLQQNHKPLLAHFRQIVPDCDYVPSVYLILSSENHFIQFYTNLVNQPLKYNNIVHKIGYSYNTIDWSVCIQWLK